MAGREVGIPERIKSSLRNRQMRKIVIGNRRRKKVNRRGIVQIELR